MKQCPDGFVTFVAFDQVMPSKDASGVRIDDEGGAPSGVEENGIGCFRADAGDRQQSLTGLVQIAL